MTADCSREALMSGVVARSPRITSQDQCFFCIEVQLPSRARASDYDLAEKMTILMRLQQCSLQTCSSGASERLARLCSTVGRKGKYIYIVFCEQQFGFLWGQKDFLGCLHWTRIARRNTLRLPAQAIE